MKVITLAAVALAATASFAFAADDITDKVMKDNPGVKGAGSTADPTAKPDSSSLSEKVMRDSPGVTGPGTTADPTAKSDAKNLTDKIMKDHPGVNPEAK